MQYIYNFTRENEKMTELLCVREQLSALRKRDSDLREELYQKFGESIITTSME